MIEKKADLNVKNSQMETILHCATIYCVSTVEFLVNQKCDLNACDLYQNTPFHNLIENDKEIKNLSNKKKIKKKKKKILIN